MALSFSFQELGEREKSTPTSSCSSGSNNNESSAQFSLGMIVGVVVAAVVVLITITAIIILLLYRRRAGHITARDDADPYSDITMCQSKDEYLTNSEVTQKQANMKYDAPTDYPPPTGHSRVERYTEGASGQNSQGSALNTTATEMDEFGTTATMVTKEGFSNPSCDVVMEDSPPAYSVQRDSDPYLSFAPTLGRKMEQLQ